MWGFVSADGKVWKPLSTERPLLIGGGTLGLPVPYLGTPEPEVCVYNSTDHAYHPTPKGNYDCWTNPSSVSDVLQMFYDDSLGEWVVHHKMWVEGPDGMEAWRRAVSTATFLQTTVLAGCASHTVALCFRWGGPRRSAATSAAGRTRS